MDWKNKLPDFKLTAGEFSNFLVQKSILTFHQTLEFVQNIPYKRIADQNDLSAIFKENGGTCSSKHGFLAKLCEENKNDSIELIAGIYLMSEETNPTIAKILTLANLAVIPEMHCYLRFKGERFDFTSPSADMSKITSKIIHEQRIEPHQVAEWKMKIHQNYLEGWLKRNPQIPHSVSEIWKIREHCIQAFTQSGF